MQEHYQEDVADTLHEYVQVTCEDDDYHCYENSNRKVLERLLEEVGYLWKVLSAKDSEYERNTHDDEDALEDVSERDLQLRELAEELMLACEVEIELAPEREVERGSEDADRCVECGERH